MECELCGKDAKLVKTNIEDAVLNVCDNCASFGRRIFDTIEMEKEKPLDIVSLDPSYATIIKLKREALGLTRDQLAKKISEKVSVIQRIENGRLRPDEKTAKKLEKVLRIRILGYEEIDIEIRK